MKSFVCSCAVALLALSGAASAATAAEAAKARIDIPHARTIALNTYPGKIVKEELEKERGGSGLRYTFDVSGSKGTREIGVDAVTGKVLENSDESQDND
ncbi:PepSY domain-containing protein [Dyella sp.]|uniref:PepSY domain-containing protein n=1 Tax=Dyella sp. TaxID=1869338 RepID=UPI003F7E9012